MVMMAARNSFEEVNNLLLDNQRKLRSRHLTSSNNPDVVRPTRIAVAEDTGEISHEMRDKVATQITSRQRDESITLVTPASSDPMALPGISVLVPSELPNITRVDRSRRICLNRNGNINDDTISDHVENDVIDNDSDSDGPPGIIDSSSEEELGRLGSDNEDDIIDPSTFSVGEEMAGHHLESEETSASTKERSTAAITVIY